MILTHELGIRRPRSTHGFIDGIPWDPESPPGVGRRDLCYRVSDEGQVYPLNCLETTALGDTHESHPSFNIPAQMCSPEAAVYSATPSWVPHPKGYCHLLPWACRPHPSKAPALPLSWSRQGQQSVKACSLGKGLNFNSGSPGFSSAVGAGQTDPAFKLSFSRNLD